MKQRVESRFSFLKRLCRTFIGNNYYKTSKFSSLPALIRSSNVDPLVLIGFETIPETISSRMFSWKIFRYISFIAYLYPIFDSYILGNRWIRNLDLSKILWQNLTPVDIFIYHRSNVALTWNFLSLRYIQQRTSIQIQIRY